MTDPAADSATAARHGMVEEQIRSRGIRDERVLAAMRQVPRHEFVPSGQMAAAYEDRALPIGLEQTISQPYMVAAMTEALRVGPAQRVLEVGTGSGYQTAILSLLASQVYTIERHDAMARRAAALLEQLGYGRIHFRVGDGSLGWPEEAPFDRILVTAGAPEVPKPLVEQLAEGGRLVVPVGRSGTQSLVVVERYRDKTVEHHGMLCRFVPLIGAAGWPEGAAPPAAE